MNQREILLCAPVRTAIGAYNGTLKDTPATDLGAAVIRETLKRAGLKPEQIGSVIMGNVIQAGNRMNPARQASIHGGVPVSVPALTSSCVASSITPCTSVVAGGFANVASPNVRAAASIVAN